MGPAAPANNKPKTGMDALMQWAKNATDGYKDVNLTNFTTSFGDGLAFAAIIHHYRPTAINFDTLKKENKAENFRIAFEAANKLGIPDLLDIEDMLVPVPDKLCVATYLSEMHKYFKRG